MADRHTDTYVPRNRSSRSQSPGRPKYPSSHRERSPHHRSHGHKRKRSPEIVGVEAKVLPYNSRQLGKRDLKTFRPMFALYLDIQKGRELEGMEEREVAGRWKSFVGKWNRGELAEGWYDPKTLAKAIDSSSSPITEPTQRKPTSKSTQREDTAEEEQRGKKEPEDDESDDEIGPALPRQEGRSSGRMGPSIPNMQDLELKREMEMEDGMAYRDDIRHARLLDRKSQKSALDELVPRAEPGTHEHKLEKKADLNAKLKSFREKSPGAALEVPDNELMGGGDGVGEFKKAKEQFERKKNEREIRREEILRARVVEREERLSEYRGKEEKTMEMLRGLAKARFG